MVEWQSVLRDAADSGKVRLAHLRRIPQLKTCDNWRGVTFLGRVRYTLPYAVYDGGLVKLADKIYYINAKQIDTVQRFAKFRNLNKVLTVEP